VNAREAERALAALEELGRKKAAPSHYVARHVLLALGQMLRAEAPGSCAALVERARVAGRAAGPAWGEAVQTELTLACGEFAQSVEPRYLSLPDYDLDYTRSARVRLGDRLRAASELGFGLSPRETEVLALADRVLAGHTARQEAGGTDPEAPATPPPRRPGGADQGMDNNIRK
jgi:hypothetical protein